MNSLTKQSWWRVPANLTIRLQSSAVTDDEIKIPSRKERSATDILMALSQTVPKTANTKPYKLQWDPYLCPISNKQQREMALSQESGRKTALWVKEQHRKLFPTDLSQPEIPLYNPPEEYEGTGKMTENYLIKLISNSQHTDALCLYKLLNKDDVSTKTKLALLELLCFHGGSNTYPEVELQVTKWFFESMENSKNTFKYTDDMKELFESLIKEDEKTVSHAYSTLICGAAQHCDAELAYTMYNHCLQNEIPLNRDAYNGVLAMARYQKRQTSECVKELQKICTTMNGNGVRADIYTYNVMLESALTFPEASVALTVAKSIMQEIRIFGLQPTLATYTYLLNIFRLDAFAYKVEIRDIIIMASSKKEYSLTHKDDLHFFSDAMRLTTKVLGEIGIADVIHETLLTGRNYKFIGSRLREMTYYRNFLLLVLDTSTFEKFQEFYDKLVPHVYQPETIITEKVIDTLQVQPAEVARKYCLKHWHDLMTFYPRQSESTTNRLLFLMVKKCELSDDSPLHEEFSNAAWDMWTHMQTYHQGKFTLKRTRFTADLLSDIIILLLRGRKYDKLITVLTFINQHISLIEGVMPSKKVDEIFKKSLLEGDTEIVFLILNYVMQNDIPGLHVMIKNARATLALTPAEETKLAQMVAPSVNPLDRVQEEAEQQEETVQLDKTVQQKDAF